MIEAFSYGGWNFIRADDGEEKAAYCFWRVVSETCSVLDGINSEGHRLFESTSFYIFLVIL